MNYTKGKEKETFKYDFNKIFLNHGIPNGCLATGSTFAFF